MRYKVGETVALVNGGTFKIEGFEKDESVQGVKVYCVGTTDEGIYVDTARDKDIDHERTTRLKRGRDAMRYKVGEKVVLRDDLTLSKETQYLKEEPNDVTGVTVSGYEIDGWHFEHDDIDHDKTAELHSISFEQMEEELNSIEPPHYNKGEIDLIESWYLTMPFDGFRWAMKSHIHKYIYRYEQKGGVEDLDKAVEFIERLKEKEDEHAGD